MYACACTLPPSLVLTLFQIRHLKNLGMLLVANWAIRYAASVQLGMLQATSWVCYKWPARYQLGVLQVAS